jgi:hypothetical protein
VTAVFVDSSVWIDHLRGNRTAQTTTLGAMLDQIDPKSGIAHPPRIIVGDLVLFEVLRGVRGLRNHARVLRMLQSHEQVDLGGAEMAVAAARHYRQLRALGVTVSKTVDCLIAAWCIARDVPLLHDDRDFEPFAVHCNLRYHTPRPAP